MKQKLTTRKIINWKTKKYLVFGGKHSEPYSWTCIPKKQTSVPSITSNANNALARYGNDSGKSFLPQYLLMNEKFNVKN